MIDQLPDLKEQVQSHAATIQGLQTTVARMERELDALRLIIYNGGSACQTANKMDPTN